MSQHVYQATTHEIRVSVVPHFIPEQSSHEDGHYFWTYTVEILNTGTQTVQLKRRHWNITDAFGFEEVVDGEGVVGEQPVLPPGESFFYTSGCPLNTPSGIMQGIYLMENDKAETLEVKIPAFSLDSPYGGQSVN